MTYHISAAVVIVAWFGLIAYLSHNDLERAKDAFMETCQVFHLQDTCTAKWEAR